MTCDLSLSRDYLPHLSGLAFHHLACTISIDIFIHVHGTDVLLYQVYKKCRDNNNNESTYEIILYDPIINNQLERVLQFTDCKENMYNLSIWMNKVDVYT